MNYAGQPAPYGPLQQPHSANGFKNGGFAFRKRFERVDWRKMASVDVEQISRTLDFNALQENIMNITFCNIESELVSVCCQMGMISGGIGRWWWHFTWEGTFYVYRSGCPKHILEKLQKVQHTAARHILKAYKWEYVSHLFRTFHWLPIQAHIKYKLSTLCHSFFSDTAPVYLSDCRHVYSSWRQLRSFSDTRSLHIPHIKTKTVGHLSFSYAAPSV